MNQPTGGGRVSRDVVTTTTRRGARDHNRALAGKLLPLFGVLGAAAAIGGPFAMIPGIEKDLTKKVESAATASGFSVTADFSGQDGTLVCSGPVDQVVLKQLAEDIKGVRQVKFDDATCNAAPAVEPAPATTLAAAPEPATTAAAPVATEAVVSQLKASAALARGAAGVVLSGIVDTEDQRTTLVKAAIAAFGTGNVTDKLAVAGINGAGIIGAGSDDHVQGLAKMLAGLKDNVVEGEAGFDGTALYLKGVYPDAATKDNLDAVISGAGVDAGHVDLSLDTATKPVAAATFAAESALGTDGKITLTGVVPNEVARTALVDAASQRVGAANVIDQLTVASPAAADDPKVEGLALMIAAMPPNLYQGSAGWDGGKFYAKGQYLSTASKAAFEAVAADVGVATTDLAIEPREAATADQAAALEKELNDLVGLTPIPFDAGQSTLRPEADAILGNVATLAKKYAGVTISVNGHTDADGSASGNQTLSDARANRVRDALVERGVPAEQLTAQGFGESQPVASNDTPENKAKNRRVVFTVVKQ